MKPLLAPLNIFAQGKAEVCISVLEHSDCQMGSGYQTASFHTEIHLSFSNYKKNTCALYKI